MNALLHQEKKESILFLPEERKLDDDGMVNITKNVSILSATHWKGTTVRDKSNPIDLMKCSKFPLEDRTAKDVVSDLVAIFHDLQPRWEAYQAYQT